VLATSSQTLWYLTRGTGVISLVLLTASVALGISEVVRFASSGWPRFVIAALHKNVALLATTFVAVHVVTSVADSFASISFADVLVPFVGTYRPLWLGLGTVAFDLLVALIVTSLLRERIGYRAWRAVHWAAYACWPVALLHSLGTGSDTRYRWAVAVNVGCLLAVLGSVLFRIGWTRTVSIGSRAIAIVGSTALALGVVAWMIVEPMRPGWARKAGTPSTLLASARSSPAAVARATVAVPFSSQVRGAITQTDAGARSTVTIDAVLPAAGNARLRVVIEGAPLSGGGVSMSQGTVRLGTDGAPDLYQGYITRLSGTSVAATARSQAGKRISLAMDFTVDNANVVGGTVSAVLGGADGN
jgi:sulfoxide reductase heme-binding subunit YedZ